MKLCINDFVSYLNKLRICARWLWAMKEVSPPIHLRWREIVRHPEKLPGGCAPCWQTRVRIILLINYSSCSALLFPPAEGDFLIMTDIGYFSHDFSFPEHTEKLVAWESILGSGKTLRLRLKMMILLLNAIVTEITIKFDCEPGLVYKSFLVC